VLPRREVCGDGIDNDCDGVVDGALSCPANPVIIEEPVASRIVVLGGCSVGAWAPSGWAALLLVFRRRRR
jgi:hypothetical protein